MNSYLIWVRLILCEVVKQIFKNEVLKQADKQERPFLVENSFDFIAVALSFLLCFYIFGAADRIETSLIKHDVLARPFKIYFQHVHHAVFY